MKKLLLSLLLVPMFGISQNIYNYGFNSPNATLTGVDGWTQTNQSVPLGASIWSVPTAAPTTTFGNAGQAGGGISFCVVNFNSTTGANTISNWLITPSITVKNGDVVTYYTRIGATAAAFADNLQVRLSSATTTVVPAGGNAALGSFTTLLDEVNPGFDLTSYPVTWTQRSITISGLPTLTPVKFAFRYYVTDGGPAGNNSDVIGIDTFSVDRTPLKSDEFINNNFSISPNPANDIVNITKNGSLEIITASITDINGRVVKQVNNDVSTINVSDLNAGVYFLKLATNEGSGVTKLIKN